MRRRYVGLIMAAAAVAGCGRTSSRVQPVAAAADAETTTTPAEDATPTTVAPDTTPTGPATTTATTIATNRTVAEPTTTFGVAITTTTTATPQQTTTSGPASTTTVAPVSTTAPQPNTTTTTLQPTPALGISKQACSAYFEKALPEALDTARLKADLAAQGYDTPSPTMFRDRNGTAIANPSERNLDDVQRLIDRCASDSGGVAKIQITVTAASASAKAYGDIAKAQLDAAQFKNYGGTTVS